MTTLLGVTRFVR
ncbi:hypothetical protein LINPERPRIM_LOCUS40578 [Linum perenne]